VNSPARSYQSGMVEAMLWVFSQWSISSQLGSGRAACIPRMISSMTSFGRSGVTNFASCAAGSVYYLGEVLADSRVSFGASR
jgi:hypothetical protein